MSLNIKNEETCRLAGELARLTGETMTGAITVALRERFERERRRRDVDVRVEKLLAIGERCAKRLAPGPSAADHGDLLYDERGLPHVIVDTSAVLAVRAWRRFGKGNHPAALNFGDCFAYALAETTGEPLLFKGNDFTRTDVAQA